MNSEPGIQKLLEAMVASRAAEQKSKDEQRAFAAALINARKAGWDPHEVWLTRVKQPRDLKRVG